MCRKSIHNSKISMIFKTIISDINKVALAIDNLQDIKIAGTVNQLNDKSLSEFVKVIDGLTLSQANAALSTKALTDAQKEQILTSAGLLQSSEAVTLEEVKQMASSMSLSAQKKEEILTTLQGAYAENEWNKEKLEAIVTSGGEAGAIAQTILAKKAENAENIKNIASGKALTKSLKEELVTRLSLMATNPAFWIAGIVAAGVGLVALQEKFSKSLKECTEELEAYNSEFETAQSSVESLETELKTCNERLSELQKLADNGTISIIEQEEYERLQKTNDELERNLRIEREKAQLSAINSVKSADETLNKTVESKYVTSLQDFSGVGVETEYSSWITPEKELNAAIEEYKRLQIEIDNLNKAYDNGEISTSDYEKQLGSLTDQQTKARTRASEMNDILSDCKQAYDNLDNTGGSFTTTQKNNYNAVTEANKRYNEFLGTINGVNEAFENLDTTEKAQTLKDKYAQKTLSLPNGQGSYTVDDKEISDWIDTLSDEDLSILGTINFSGEQTKDSMQEALDYAKTHTEVTSDEMSVLNIRDYLNQEDLKDVKDELFNLFKTGELNEDSINSIREFRDMLTATGLSAKDAVNEIEQFFEASNETIDLSDWKTQLNEARNAINSLKTIKGEIGSGYSDSSINTIISDYPQLLAYLDDESSMLEAVNNLLDEQSLKAEIAADKMLEFNPNIYKEVISQVYSDLEQSNSSLIQTLATGYGIDLNNFSSLAQAKEEIDKQLLQTLMEMWGEYYGIVVDSVTGLASVTQNLPDFYQNEEAQNQLATYNQIITKLNATADKFNNGLDFGSLGDDASKAGGDAGDAYVDAYEEAVKKLDDLKSQGKITEKQYLDYLRKLYEKYFKNIGKYAEKFAQEQAKYLSGMKSLYESALSGITSMIDRQISSYQDQKDAAVDALEEQKEAAVDALEAERDARIEVLEVQKEQLEEQIDLIDEQIKAKEKVIDGINDEIDAMRDANDERKRNIDLQKAQFELEKMQHQRTKLVNICQTL